MNATSPDGSDCTNRNDWVPAWMIPFGIKEAGCFIDSKARAKREKRLLLSFCGNACRTAGAR